MGRKFAETFFRHKLLILLPPVGIFTVVTAITVLTATPTYQSSAAVWVERAAYIDTADDWNRFTAPAENQSTRLAQMLQSRSFVMEVAARTALAPLIGDDKGEETIRTVLARGLAITPRGSNLLAISFRSPSPDLSLQMVTAILDRFKERAAVDKASQGEQAIVFYESRLRDAEQQFAKSADTLRRYVAGNSRLRSAGPSRGGSTGVPADVPVVIDPQLVEMQSRVDLDQGEVERARRNLENARLQTSAGIEAQEVGFRVVDPPQLAVRPIRDTPKMLIAPAASLLVGVGLSAVLLVFLVAADRTVRSESDLPTSVTVIGTIPEFQSKALPKRAGRDATRRTMGFVAGSALPSPQGSK